MAEYQTLLPLAQAMQSLGKKIADPEFTELPEEALPGLPELIRDWYSSEGISEEDYFRRLLGVFKNSCHGQHYDQELSRLEPSHRNAIEAFVAGHQSLRDIAKVGPEHYNMTESRKSVSSLATISPPQFIRGFASRHILAESQHSEGESSSDFEFKNWGQTVAFTPASTFYPRNTAEIQSIVQHSVENKQGIRVSGFRHSWAPLFGRNNKPSQNNNGDVLISMLPEYVVGRLPNFTALPSCFGEPAETDLNHISFVGASFVQGQQLENGGRYVRIGAATTNEQFRRWCCETGKVTFPANVLMVEMTIGGVNAPICHGAGIKHQTISDRVRCIEYVDTKGNLGRVDMSSPELIKTAAGCFGLLGVVTHLTFECDPISAAVMRPVKLDVMRAIPPPPDMPDSAIPAPLRMILTAEQKQKDLEDFVKKADNDYYSEWFWFPFSSKVWINCWSTDDNINDVVDYPNDAMATLEVIATIGANIAQVIVQQIDWLEKFPMQQTMFLSWISMKIMADVGPDDKSIRTLLPNGLHFQRGIQNLRVKDLEIEFPLHPKKGTQERDYRNVQKAWWDAIISCYEHQNTSPQRMPLEMRIIGDSNMTMAPQRGNIYGTCSIEILTLNAATDIWYPYAQKVLDKWLSLKDPEGKPLKVLPHWAKEWQTYTVNGKPWPIVLKTEAYPVAIKEFKEHLGRIAKKQGLELADLQRVYSNEMLDFLFFDDIVSTEAYTASIEVHTGLKTGHGFAEQLKHDAHVIVEELKHLVGAD